MIIALVPRPTAWDGTMTKKEAIANLKSHWTADGFVEDYKAMDMAIEALEKADRVCEDCICYTEIEAGCGFCCEKNMSVDAMMCCQHFGKEKE